MNIKQVLSVLAAGVVATSAMAKDENDEEKDSRMSIMVGCIATPDTRTDVMFKPINAPKISCPYSDADLQNMTGDELGLAKSKIMQAKLEQSRALTQIAYEEYRREQQRQKEIIRKAQGTKFGRLILIARDKLTAAFTEYSDQIKVISRVDDGEAQLEKFLSNGGEAGDLAESSFFVKAIICDPKDDSASVNSYGSTITKRTQKLPIIVTIQDLRNNVVFSKEFAGVKKTTSSSAVSNTGTDFDFDELMTDAFKQAAKAFYEEVTVGLKIKVKAEGVKKVNMEDVTITLDGDEVSADEEVRVSNRCGHEIQVELDGFTQKTKPFFTVKKGQKTVTKTIQLKKAKAEAEGEEKDDEE